MPQSSYQTPNSYQELDFKPYALDYSSVLKEASAKTSYWMEGAAKIQQAYSKITGLNPTIPKNREALNEFNNQVKEKIKKLAGVNDLGIQGNANMINDVIAPLYDVSNKTSEFILRDDQSNKLSQKVLKDIEGYKTKDKGAYYSKNNEEYATEWIKKYRQLASKPDASLEDLKNLENDIKQYTPYYDYQKELEFAIAKCPENVGSTDTPNQGYMQNVKITSKNTTGCIQGFLSPKALSQMQIDGYVEYGKNYRVVGEEFSRHALEVNTFSQKEIGRLKAQQLTKGITPEVSKALQDEIDAIHAKVKYNNDIVNKVSKGDFSDIKNNYESFAGNIYTRNKIKGFSNYNKNPEDNTEIHLNDDVTYLAKAKMQNDNYQEAINRQVTISENALNRQATRDQTTYKETMANQRAAADSKGAYIVDKNGNLVPAFGQGIPGQLGNGEEFSLETVLDESANKEQTEGTFIKEGQDIQNNKASVMNGILNLINNTYGSRLSKPVTMAEFPEFYKNLSPEMRADIESDSDYKAYKAQLSQVGMAESMHNSELRSIEKRIKQDLAPIEKEKITIKTTNGNFTILKKDINKYVTESEVPKNTTGMYGNYYYQAYFTNLNNKKVTILNTDVISKAKSDISSIRNKHYSKAKTYNTMKVTTNSLNNIENEPIRTSIFNKVSGMMNVDENGKDDGLLVKSASEVRTGKTDGHSTIEVIIPTKNKQTGDIVAKEIGSNDRTATYLGNGKYEIKYNDPSKFPQQLRINNTSFFTEGTSRIINNIQEDDFYKPNDKVYIYDDFNGFEVFMNKGNPLIYFKKKGSSALPGKVDNVSKLQDYLNPQR